MLQFANVPVDEALEAVHRRLNNDARESRQICPAQVMGVTILL